MLSTIFTKTKIEEIKNIVLLNVVNRDDARK